MLVRWIMRTPSERQPAPPPVSGRSQPKTHPRMPLTAGFSRALGIPRPSCSTDAFAVDPVEQTSPSSRPPVPLPCLPHQRHSRHQSSAWFIQPGPTKRFIETQMFLVRERNRSVRANETKPQQSKAHRNGTLDRLLKRRPLHTFGPFPSLVVPVIRKLSLPVRSPRLLRVLLAGELLIHHRRRLHACC